MNTKLRPITPLILLSLCLLFIALGAFYGGIAMLNDPEGSPLEMPVSYLEKTPFQDYFVPGLILIAVWGFGSLALLACLWIRPRFAWLDAFAQVLQEHWVWGLTILYGIALFVWLTVQILTLPEVAVIQYILYALSLLIVGIPFLPKMRHYYGLS